MTQASLIQPGEANRVKGTSFLTGRVWILLTAVALFRLIYAAVHQLVPDEAFYWTWTRHLYGGYFDHPPMIAYLMYLSTRLLGNNELGVRLFAVLLAVGSLAMALWLADRLLGDRRATGFVAVLLLCSPFFSFLGTILTPDTPAIFFSMCGLACVLTVVRSTPAQTTRWRSPLLWLSFGVSCGLAFLSKYTTVLLPAAVFLALLFSRDGRRHLRQPWIYLAAVVAVAVCSPVLWWNYQHNWVSFRWQMGHGLAQEADAAAAAPLFASLPLQRGYQVGRDLLQAIGGLGEFIGGQALPMMPVLFAVGLVVLVYYWRRCRGANVGRQVLLWCATLPLVFFAYASTRTHGEVNWPDFAYFPLVLLIAMYLAENWSRQRVQWVKIGCIVALVATVATHFPAVLCRLKVPGKNEEMFGCGEMGAQLDRITAGTPLICTKHGDAGEAAFYMTGHPDVWRVALINVRPSSFDYYDRPFDFAAQPRLWLMGKHENEAKEFCGTYGFTQTRTVALATDVSDRKRQLFLLEKRATVAQSPGSRSTGFQPVDHVP